jgi:hypothetical protein
MRMLGRVAIVFLLGFLVLWSLLQIDNGCGSFNLFTFGNLDKCADIEGG